MNSPSKNQNDGDSSDSDSDVAFAAIDLSNVNFDEEKSKISHVILAAEDGALFGTFGALKSNDDDDQSGRRVYELHQLLSEGKYKEALVDSQTAHSFFGTIDASSSSADARVAQIIRNAVVNYATDLSLAVELELLAVAALNLFLQLNYTGPLLESADGTEDPLVNVNPHACFRARLNATTTPDRNDTGDEKKENRLTAPKRDTKYHNTLLAELAVDGEWPCQVCQAPYLLLLARSVLSALASPRLDDWTHSSSSTETNNTLNNPIEPFFQDLRGVQLWSARAVVAHERLLQAGEPSVTLWNEARQLFRASLETYCSKVDTVDDDTNDVYAEKRLQAATVVLEWGLAQHHFNRPGMGKVSFQKSMEYSGVQVEMTGAMGKRTKFQQDAKAQMTVHAASRYSLDSENKPVNDDEQQTRMKSQMVEHSEDGILLERIKFEDKKENEISKLTTLDQAILLSLCLDVKNSNPADGLTAEQMGAYLARVLEHHDNWMIYSTALLERAWLECEQTHGRERAILQIQALADQHTNRLTITQSTFSSVEDSAPPQERLRHLHSIVYPPRWAMIRDLAERYAKIGIVTSAAELFEEIELWDEVVECYRHAGKASKAEQVVRERLAESETPRMWAALGDLSNDPSHYEKALEISNGRYSSAYVALGKYHFDKGDIVEASKYYKKALEIRPLMPHVWFRLGTIGMQLGDWELALSAFSEVVQQEPEEADAWANVAAVHLHNKQPAEAYPALLESLKFRRNNWRVWTSKLYTCIDLKKYDEAIQACHILMDLKASKNASEAIPTVEEKCIRAIVGGSINAYQDAAGDEVKLDSARRTLSRVRDLLERLSSTTKPEPWIWETLAFFNEQVGRDEAVFDNLMKEYRSLLAIHGWEKDTWQVKKVTQVVSHISQFHKEDGSKESLSKCKFMLSGVVKKIRSAYLDESKIPEEVGRLEKLLDEVEKLLQAKE